jgi:FdhD protein
MTPTCRPEPGSPAVPADVIHVGGGDARSGPDLLAVEDPLEIRLGFGPANDRMRKAVSVTMRTPGHDSELAVGFLYSEGVIGSAGDVLAAEEVSANVIRVDLKPGVPVDLGRLERHFYTASSCGVCGKTSLEAVEQACDPLPAGPVVAAEVVHALPRRLRVAQSAFDRTGGLHAAALFDEAGVLIAAREDVGRHNAVDKVIGREFLRGNLPLHRTVLFVSGRASFELVQKAAVAGVPVFAAVGAPSSLAADLARRVGMTLLGFVRDGRFNVYAGAERLIL